MPEQSEEYKHGFAAAMLTAKRICSGEAARQEKKGEQRLAALASLLGVAMIYIRPENEQSVEELLETLRSRQWRVGVHNDYELNGETYTFWLFTHWTGHFVRGEGKTDHEALLKVLEQIDELKKNGCILAEKK